jgi:hypothetical protein
MIDTQQQYIKLNIRGEISIIAIRDNIVLLTLFSKIALYNRSCMHYNKDTHKLKAQKVTAVRKT